MSHGTRAARPNSTAMAAEARLLQAHQSGKLHHAWLISGPRGIGKATLAYRFAKFLLQVPTAAAARAHTTLHMAPEAPAFRQVAAGAHPDLLVIERAVDRPSGSRPRSRSTMRATRRASSRRTSGAGGWRIAIVDAADDLNAESANALLKVIEEPPKQSIFLIVCHQPGRLLRTIRSRCLHLPLDAALRLTTRLKVLRRPARRRPSRRRRGRCARRPNSPAAARAGRWT